MSSATAPRAGADCTPQARVARSLLGYGLLAGPFYVLASAIEGLARPGFDFTRHDWSLLALGGAGWIHVTVLVLTGLMVIAAAVGVVREGTSRTAGWALAVYGAGLVGAGAFPADPMAGFPPGEPEAAAISWHGLLHLLCGGIGFLGLVVCCLLFARRFLKERARGWALFSLVTGVLFLAGFALVAGGPATGSVGVLSFTAAVLLAWTWLLLVCLRLFRGLAEAAR